MPTGKAAWRSGGEVEQDLSTVAAAPAPPPSVSEKWHISEQSDSNL